LSRNRFGLALLNAWVMVAPARADMRPGFGTPIGPLGETAVLGAVAVGLVGFLVWALRRGLGWALGWGASEPPAE
jgi:hypothetical protein